VALGSTQPLTEMSTRNHPGGGGVKGGRPARNAFNLTAICEPIVETKCVSLDVSQSYGPPRPVTGIALPLPSLPLWENAYIRGSACRYRPRLLVLFIRIAHNKFQQPLRHTHCNNCARIETTVPPPSEASPPVPVSMLSLTMHVPLRSTASQCMSQP
jgi:hypothetical protein